MADPKDNNDDNWKSAVDMLTGYMLPERSKLFENLKGNDDIPLMHVRLHRVSPYYVPGHVSQGGWHMRKTDYVFPFLGPERDPTNQSEGRAVASYYAYITFLASGQAAPPSGNDVIPSYKKTSDKLKDKGGWNKEGDKLDWDTGDLTRYVYGSKAALDKLTTWPHSTHGFADRSSSVADDSYVDLGSFTDAARAFDRAVSFFANSAVTVGKWDNENIGEGSDAWDGTPAAAFKGLIHKLARNYEGYADQLKGEGETRSAVLLDGTAVASKPAVALAELQQTILTQAQNLVAAWNSWKADSNPQRWLYDMLQEARLNSFNTQFGKTELGISTGHHSDSYIQEALAGFDNNLIVEGVSYGQAHLMESWKKLAEEAVRRWESSAQNWLSVAGADAIVALTKAFAEAGKAFDSKLTDKDKRPISEIMSKETRDKEKKGMDKEKAAAKAAAEKEKEEAKRLRDEEKAQAAKEKAEAKADAAKEKAEAKAEQAAAKEEAAKEKNEAKAEADKEKNEAKAEQAAAKEEAAKEKDEVKAQNEKDRDEAKQQAAQQQALAVSQADRQRAEAKKEKDEAKAEQEQEKAQAKAEQEAAKQEAQQEKTEAKQQAEQEKAQAQQQQDQARQEAQQEKTEAKQQAEQEKAQAQEQQDQARQEAVKEKQQARLDAEQAKADAQADYEQQKAEAREERATAEQQADRQEAAAKQEYEQQKAEAQSERDQAQQQAEQERAEAQRDYDREVAGGADEQTAREKYDQRIAEINEAERDAVREADDREAQAKQEYQEQKAAAQEERQQARTDAEQARRDAKAEYDQRMGDIQSEYDRIGAGDKDIEEQIRQRIADLPQPPDLTSYNPSGAGSEYSSAFNDNLYNSDDLASALGRPQGNDALAGSSAGSPGGPGAPMMPQMMRGGGGEGGSSGERVRNVVDPGTGRSGRVATPGPTVEDEEHRVVPKATQTSSSSQPFMPPMGGMPGAGGGPGQQTESSDRERTTWLAEDEDVWGTDEGGVPQALGR